MYDEDIKFKASSKYSIGQKYCVIISEQCYDTANHTSLIIFECDNCGVEVKALSKNIHQIDNHTITHSLGNKDVYEKMKFCSNKCCKMFIEKKQRRFLEERDLPEDFEGWISKDNLVGNKNGYIYKITKKSTREFYVGQSIYVPIFRWGQHLKTERFPLSGIEDYKFEVIEIVGADTDINEREKYWIQTLYKENPDLSLNISLTKCV